MRKKAEGTYRSEGTDQKKRDVFSPVRSFRLMVAFFTRIPAGIPEYSERLFSSGIKTLPLVGVLIGLLLYFVSFLRYLMLPDGVLALILVISYCMITGGLHFDGVADTCDAIFSGRDRERMLEIMKDSRTGTFGVMGLILLLLSYYVLFAELGTLWPQALICLPVVGKSAMVASCWKAGTARNSGMGYAFILRVGRGEVICSLLAGLAVSILTGPACIIGALLAFGAAFSAREYFERRLGGLTGDVLGCICELSQVVFAAGVFLTVHVAETFF